MKQENDRECSRRLDKELLLKLLSESSAGARIKEASASEVDVTAKSSTPSMQKSEPDPTAS